MKSLFHLYGKAMLLLSFAMPSLCRAVDFSALDRLNYRAVQGEVGVGVLDMQTGESWFRHGDRRFPMQSVYKVPIAIAVLDRVDAGTLALDGKVTLRRDDIAPLWSPISKKFDGDRAETTIRELIEYSVGLSDNTAADALIEKTGGAERVMAVLRRLKIKGVRVDRTEKQLQTESVGIARYRPEMADDAVFREAAESLSPAARTAALERYLSDARDTSTPRAMVELLSRLAKGELLSDASTRFLLQVMTDSPTGQKRLKAGLPAGWTVAHKTGTGGDVSGRNSATNDAGIMTSPSGRKIAVAVFVAGSRAPIELREKLMADVAAALASAYRSENP